MRTTLLTVSLLAALAVPSAVRAQTFTATVQPFGDPERPQGTQLWGTTAGSRPIGIEECEENVQVPVNLANIPTTERGVLAVYRAAVGSGMCTVPANRTSTGGSQPICEHTSFTAPMIVPTQMTVSPTVQELFGSDACTMAAYDDREFWFLSVSSDPDISTTVTQFAVVRILLDTQRPVAPMVDEAPAGDTTISVGFDANTTELLAGATAYVDVGGCDANGNVATTTLVPNMAPPSGARSVASTGVEAVTLDGSMLGLEYGEYAAVAVTTMDLARNESVLSNVVCLQRVELSGFWDAYCAERGITDPAMCRAQYSGCAATPGRGSAPSLAIAMLGIAIAFVMSRAARRSSR